jgi:hypothetical protein
MTVGLATFRSAFSRILPHYAAYAAPGPWQLMIVGTVGAGFSVPPSLSAIMI